MNRRHRETKRDRIRRVLAELPESDGRLPEEPDADEEPDPTSTPPIQFQLPPPFSTRAK
jgi:hypothetical protein